ncbi:MAG: hypothetical protein AMXMBFR58_24830 [Phycisphaerae bacterium]|nr:hypothetical protein [Phycisphaerales bacterium]
MRWLVETAGGLWELGRLAVITRLRFKGPYWNWRMHTAFGRGMPGRGETIRAVLAYGRWIYRMRRGR